MMCRTGWTAWPGVRTSWSVSKEIQTGAWGGLRRDADSGIENLRWNTDLELKHLEWNMDLRVKDLEQKIASLERFRNFIESLIMYAIMIGCAVALAIFTHCLTQIVTLREWLPHLKCYRKLGRRPHGGRRQQDGEFLASLPNPWQQGEARPTHRDQVRSPRHWRTRNDLFEGVWCDVLSWLQKAPDTNAKNLLAKLREIYPDRFGDTHLRTLQSRVKDWRGVMAKGLLYPASDEPTSELSEKVGSVLVGVENKG